MTECYYTFAPRSVKVVPSTTGYPFSDAYARYDVVYVIVEPERRVYVFNNGYLRGFTDYFRVEPFEKEVERIKKECKQL